MLLFFLGFGSWIDGLLLGNACVPDSFFLIFYSRSIQLKMNEKLTDHETLSFLMQLLFNGVAKKWPLTFNYSPEQ